MDFEKPSLKCYAYLRQDTLFNTSLKVTTRHLCIDRHNQCGAQCKLYHAHQVTWYRSECCVSSGLNFEAASGSLYVIIFAPRGSGCCKHDMGALSWLNAETLKRRRCIRYSCINTAYMSPTLNGSSALQSFKDSNVIKIHNRIMFNFYLGLPHMYQ